MDPVYKRWILKELRDAKLTGDRVVTVRRRWREPPIVGRLFYVDLLARGAPHEEIVVAAKVIP